MTADKHNKYKELVSIIIPTYNNTHYLRPCIVSLINSRQGENLAHIYVVNNGHPNSCDWIDPQHKFVTVLQSGGENLGWEGGLELGLKATSAPYVLFLNDDTLVPYSEKLWLNKMMQFFRDPEVAAVGPSTNMVMGMQNMLAELPMDTFTSTFLIFFCALIRRSALEEVGGVDCTLPGGDDLDLSIRLRNAGYKLIVDRNVFVFHYGSQTGIRLHGNHDQDGGWNSPRFTDNVNLALIKKHGFKSWWTTLRGAYTPPSVAYNFKKDSEGNLIRERVPADGLKVIDIGVGNLKTYPHAIGIDVVKKDDFISQIGGDSPSVADIQADVSQPLPLEDNSVDIAVARHILEHLINPLEALRNWTKVLKKGGKLVVSVPNEYLIRSIPMNPEHVIAFTPESLKTWVEAAGGLKIVDMWDSENQISFTTVIEKL